MNVNGANGTTTDDMLEEEFAIAFGLLRRCPQVTEIDFGAQVLPEDYEFSRLEEISKSYGLQLRVYDSGRVTVRRPTSGPIG